MSLCEFFLAKHFP